MMCALQEAAIAQLDRVQVSEACGVGSSPAERTISLFYLIRSNTKIIKNKQLMFLSYPIQSEHVLGYLSFLR